MIIAGLQPETAYSITVAAYTMKGDGARSKPKVVTTKGAGESLLFTPFLKPRSCSRLTFFHPTPFLKDGLCSKSQAAPKGKLDLARQKPLHSSHAALTKCHSFLSSASESPGTHRNTTEDEFVTCNLLGCEFQWTRRKVTLPGVTPRRYTGDRRVCCQGGDLQRPAEQQADSGACPAHSSLLVPP